MEDSEGTLHEGYPLEYQHESVIVSCYNILI